MACSVIIKPIPWKATCRLLPFYIFYLLLTLAASGNFFFWDTVQLGSKHAHWYYDHHFRYFLLPDSLDSGHIPVFGTLLAATWTVFQKSLLVSHLMMLPFLLGIVHQSYQLVSFFFSKRNVFYMMILLMLDPTLLSQSILVSPDIVLVFFLLFSLNMILQNRRLWLLFGLIALSLISMRGMMLVVVLFVIDLYINLKRNGGEHRVHNMIGILMVYIPAGLMVMGFLAYHYHSKGWIGYHAGSPWAPSFEKVDFGGFLYNIALFFWRLIDSGRIVLWIVFLMVITFMKKRMPVTENMKVLGMLVISMMVILPASMLLHANLLAHRYLLPIYLSFTLLVCYAVFELIKKDKLKKPLYILMAIGLITGNFWVYPDHIAKGWDATLAHIPYYHLRNKMVDYIETKGIPYTETGTAFPNLASFKYIDLSENNRSFAEKDLSVNKYVFYSNIMNEFTDAEIDELKNEWIPEKEFRCMQVYVTLYRNPGFE